MTTYRTFLHEHAAHAQEALGPGAHVGVGVWADGAAVRSAASDDLAQRCVTAEAEHQEGPSVLAVTELRGVLVPDVALEVRWDAWRAETAAAGFRSVAVIPALAGRDGAVVAVSIYSRELDPWDATTLVVADGLAHELAARIGRVEQGPAVQRGGVPRSR